MLPPIYCDYNATSPVDPRVLEAMSPFYGPTFGNPSSIHQLGRQARACLDEARESVADVWRCKPSEVVFTSGGTESVNLAVFGAARALKDRGRHLIASSIEHPAVLESVRQLSLRDGFSFSLAAVDSQGRLDPGAVEALIRPDTILVSVMAANNEVGAVQPVARIGELCRSRGIVFHTDAVQAFGKLPFNSIHQFEADLVSSCCHKFHGPKGSGALFVRSPFQIQPQTVGGSHENDRRAGTENVAALAGFAMANRLFVRQPVYGDSNVPVLIAALQERLRAIPGLHVAGLGADRLPNTLACAVEGCDSLALLAGLDLDGICASSGSACASGSLEPSHVLRAMGFSEPLSRSLVRFSLGRENTQADIERIAQVFPKVIERVRGSRSPIPVGAAL